MKTRTITLRLVVAVLLTTAAAVVAEEPLEPVIEKPLPPEEAAMTKQVPDGFRVTLFAAERRAAADRILH